MLANNVHFTSALRVLDAGELSIDDLHITTCFAKLGRTKKCCTTSERGVAKVLKIEHWTNCDLTVAIVECELAEQRNKYFRENGFQTDENYIAHITLAKHDEREKFAHLLDREFSVGDEYIRLY